MPATLVFDSRRSFSPRNFASGLLPPKPEPDPLDGLSLAFALGYLFGRQDRDPSPPEAYTPGERECYQDGIFAGQLEINAERARDWADHLEAMALDTEWADQCNGYVLDR